jgi:hypothetical protein
MAPAERLVVCVGVALLSACLTGLFARRRQGLCVSFTLYLGAVLVSDTLVLLWPDRFHTWAFWVPKESVHNLLKFGIALELTLRTFRAFPAARRTAAGLVLAVLALTWFSVGPTPLGKVTGPEELALELQPYVLAGTLWLFIAISVLILWYRLPVAPLHKAVLLGFVPYLLIFTVAMNLLKAFGGNVRELVGYFKNAAYQALLLYWAYTAWRPGPPVGRGRKGAATERPAA